jgi:hypothetical protein
MGQSILCSAEENWRIPSKAELKVLFNHRAKIGWI